MDTLDPTILRAIKLLLSTSKSSKDQLRNMLDEAMSQRRAQLKLSPITIGMPIAKSSVKPRELASTTKTKPKDPAVPQVKTEPPEADLDSETTDIEENDKDDKEILESTTVIDKKDAADLSEASDPFNLETMAEFGDISCVVCKNIDYKPGNQLVECQECHSLYHQECHKPLLTSSEISDPRNIWYCAKCTKNIKKTSTKMAKSSSSSSSKSSQNDSPATTSSAFQAAIKMGKESAMHLVKAKQQLEQSFGSSGSSNTGSTSSSGGNGSSSFTPVPFKRATLDASKSTTTSSGPSSTSTSVSSTNTTTSGSSTAGATATSSSSTTPNKPVGLAGLAAISKSFSSSSSSSKSADSDSKASSTASSTSPALVDKKLQMLKRKAKSASAEPRTKKLK